MSSMCSGVLQQPSDKADAAETEVMRYNSKEYPAARVDSNSEQYNCRR